MLEGQGGGRGGRGGAPAGADPSFSRVTGELLGAYNLIQAADVAPTTQAEKAAADALAAVDALMVKWTALKSK